VPAIFTSADGCTNQRRDFFCRFFVGRLSFAVLQTSSAAWIRLIFCFFSIGTGVYQLGRDATYAFGELPCMPENVQLRKEFFDVEGVFKIKSKIVNFLKFIFKLNKHESFNIR
jgi:hypothetical protein